jgi:carboxypeptidase family protein
MRLMRLFLSFLFVQACFSQTGARDPGYRNSDPPNCGSFHTRRIQGTVTDPSGSPLKDVEVEVFDDVSHKPLWKTATDEAGRFSINQHWRGQLRIVFSSPGFLTEDWAVTITEWPDGGLFRSKAMPVALEVIRGDSVSICPPIYSR